MKKKWLSILLAGALSITLTGTAFASSGESEGGHSGGSSSKSSSGYSQSSEHKGGGSGGQTGNNGGWANNEEDKEWGPAHDNNRANSQNIQGQNNQFHFSDMGEAEWAAPYVMKLQGKDVVKGYPDGSFKPNQPVNRAESITMMARSQGATPQGTTQTAYVDAPGWACDYVNWAVDKQILIPGEDHNRLQSEKPATRLWIAQMAVRALGLDAQATVAQDTYLPFKDVSAIPSDMAGYIKLATEKGIFVGYPDCTFQPNKPITRAEMSIIMSRLDAMMNNETLGTVTAADAGSITVSVAGSVYGGVSKTFDISPGATVWLNNSTATISDIKPGDVVEIKLNAQGQAIMVDAANSQTATAPAPAPATMTTAQGTVSAVDTGNSKITVKGTNGTETTYDIASTVTINILNDPALKTLADILAGDTIILTFYNNVVVDIDVIAR